MQTLSLSLLNREDEGRALPPVFRQLEILGAKARGGQVTMIAGPDSVGKSALMSFWARNLIEDGDYLPGLYFSADSDKMTFGKAALAGAMDIHTNEAERLITANDRDAMRLLDERAGHMWVSFQSDPSPGDIRLEVEAFAHAYGSWPRWVVVDNLMDVDATGGGEDQRQSQEAVIKWLKVLARETGAAVFVLLHVKGDYITGDEPIPLRALMNNVSKPARLVFTLHHYDHNVMGVSIVKNSTGPHQKDGSMYVTIPWLPEKAWMERGY